MNKLLCTTLLAVCLPPAVADEKPFVHQLFSDDMVLQRDISVPVWGWTTPGSTVTVRLNGQSSSGEADRNGRWQVSVGPLPAGGPHTLTVDGEATVQFNNVMMGDVWICSGQSNMEWPVAASDNATGEIAAANHPHIRLFTVPKRISLQPQETVVGKWSACSPETIPRFSAVAYFFGRKLQSDLNVPIGLIHTSWGGTIAEAWTSAAALKTMNDFRPAVARFEEQVRRQLNGGDNFEQRMAAWWKKVDVGTANGWAAREFDTTQWKSMNLPVRFEQAGLPDYDGVVWFQKRLDLPADWSDKTATIHLGPIDDQDTVWINGRQVGTGNNWAAPRQYKVPNGLLREGNNTITVRVLDTGGDGGLYGQPQQMKLQAGNSQQSIPLSGSWRYRATTSLKQPGLAPRPQRIGQNPNVTTVLYNGMIAPLIPFGIKGAIWYQGESNAGRAEQYRTLLPTMIRDWRSQFEVGEFPFLIVQLANFMAPQTSPVEPGWAELREAQWLTAESTPQTGLAVITDIGAANDIHPRNKQEVGRRLAKQALRMTYNKNVIASGPTFDEMQIENDTVRLSFTNTANGLMVAGPELKGFAIAARQGEFAWAKAKIEGTTVVLSADGIASPARVRYAWANNPIGNLFNSEQLPAVPFRTDLDEAAIRILDTSLSPAAPLNTAKPESVGMSATKLNEVRPLLQRFVDEGKIPGAIVAVARKGKLVLFDAVGSKNIDDKSPMQKNSVLRFYSMSKPITSVAAMMLVEDGHLKLDEPVSSYIPEFKSLRVFAGDTANPAKTVDQQREFTVRDLLRHTSGLTYGAFGNSPVDQTYQRNGVLDSDGLPDMMERLSRIPLLYQPGTKFNYSVSTDVLGRVVEVVSGQSLDEYFGEHIFAPLGMTDTGFYVPVHEQQRFASTHTPGRGGLFVSDPAWKSTFIANPKMLSGGGGLVSTAHDYVRFCQMLINKGELDGERLLQPETVAIMTKDQLPASAFPISVGGPPRPGVGFGLGFSVVVDSRAAPHRVGEYGWGGLASTHFWISPKHDLAVVLLTQHIPFSFQLENAVKPIVYEAILD